MLVGSFGYESANTLPASRGLIGPARQFNIGDYYNPMLYWLLAGAVLPVITWLLARRFPNTWLTLVSVPVAISGLTLMPPATGINFSSSLIVCFIFRASASAVYLSASLTLARILAEYFVRHRYFRWWSKYNFVLSAGLDAGTVLSGIVIFFALQLPKGGSICASFPFALSRPAADVFSRSAQLVGQRGVHQHARLAGRLVQDAAARRIRSDVVVRASVGRGKFIRPECCSSRGLYRVVLSPQFLSFEPQDWEQSLSARRLPFVLLGSVASVQSALSLWRQHTITATKSPSTHAAYPRLPPVPRPGQRSQSAMFGTFLPSQPSPDDFACSPTPSRRQHAPTRG